jgi:pimeloyl-ACP methyl ester carboxylesterase
LTEFAERLRQSGAAEARRSVIEGMMFLPSDDPAVKARVVEDMLRPPDHVAAACMEALADWDFDAAWAAVAVPVLAINAGRPLIDQPDPPVSLPGLVSVQTPGVGHFNQLLAPAEVNHLIEQFVA